MTDKQLKNTNWSICDDEGKITEWDQCILSVLMDIRDELQQLNRRMECREVTDGFWSIKKHYLYTRKRWPVKKRNPKTRKEKL